MKNPSTKAAQKAEKPAFQPVTITRDGISYTFCHATTAAKAEKVAAILNKPTEERTPADIATLVNALWIVHHHDGETESKLAGLDSISTSAIYNKFCAARIAKSDYVCARCYAVAQQKQYSSLNEHNTINGWILKEYLIPVEYLDLIPVSTIYARIESFGDVETVTQAKNYLHIIKAKARTSWGVWTKNPTIWAAAIREEGKPDNAVFVISSPRIDKETSLNLYPEFFDHVFTVYSKGAIKAGKEINCPKKCRDCLQCYRPAGNGNPARIAERLKEDSTVIYQVDYTDPITGATSHIDVITAQAGYTVADYVRDCTTNADPDCIQMLTAGHVTLITPEN